MESVTNSPSSTSNNHSVSLYRRIAAVFLVLTSVVVGIVLYMVFLRATVIVLSDQEKVTADSIIDIAQEPLQGEVRGDVVEASERLSQSFPATSVVRIDTHAEGEVEITSTLFRPQTLVATTRLLTPDGTLFRLRRTVVVPAFGSTTAEVFADEVGTVGDVGSTTFTIPGLNPETQKFFTVRTVEPITGSVEEVQMITREDVESATQVMKEKMEAELADRIRADARLEGLEDPGEMFSFEVEEEFTDEPIGSEAEEFVLVIAMRATGVFFDKAEFMKQVEADVRALIPYDRTMHSIEEESLSMTVEKRDLIGRRAHVRISATGYSILSPESPPLNPAKLVGVTAEAAEAYLQNIEGVSSASVRLRPFWSKRMPNVADHIKLEVR